MTTDLDRLIEAVEAGFLKMATVIRSPVAQWGSLVLASFDGSTAAAVALLEALLPGQVYDVERDVSDVYRASVGQDRTFGRSEHSPARALLLATLRAYRRTKEGG